MSDIITDEQLAEIDGRVAAEKERSDNCGCGPYEWCGCSDAQLVGDATVLLQALRAERAENLRMRTTHTLVACSFCEKRLGDE